MHAIRVHETGGPEVLQYEEVATPEPGTGEARLRLEAIGVNFIDLYHRSGQYKLPLPFIPGEEAAGVIDAIGPDVTEVKVGDRVAFAMNPKAYAEYAVVPSWKLVPVPDGIVTQNAAAIMEQGLTAHYLATSTYPIQPGQTVLVHAAAGGVGSLLVQVAKKRGARVLGTVSTEEKARAAREAGVDEAILYTQVDFEQEVKRLTNGQGVDAVFDSVGKTTFDQSLNCLVPRGTLVLYGQSSGAVPPLDPQILNAKGSLYLTRPTLRHYTRDRAELLLRAHELFDGMRSGEIKVRIDQVFPLAQAAEAHRYLASRQSKGKVILVP